MPYLIVQIQPAKSVFPHIAGHVSEWDNMKYGPFQIRQTDTRRNVHHITWKIYLFDKVSSIEYCNENRAFDDIYQKHQQMIKSPWCIFKSATDRNIVNHSTFYGILSHVLRIINME